MDPFRLIEKPAEAVFHYVHDLAELKAAKLDQRYAEIEHLRYEDAHLPSSKILLSANLSMDDWQYQDEKVYELTPSLRFWHTLQLKAKVPRHWWSEFKAALLRGQRGFDHRATYDFRSWHTDIVVKALTEYRKNKHGHPGHMTEQQWDIVVDGMIDAFERLKAIDADLLDDEESQRRVDFAFKVLSTYYLYLWD